MSDRSYPDYPGGTSRQRELREILRAAMEAEGSWYTKRSGGTSTTRTGANTSSGTRASRSSAFGASEVIVPAEAGIHVPVQNGPRRSPGRPFTAAYAGATATLERHHLGELHDQRATGDGGVGGEESLVVVDDEQVAQRMVDQVEADVGVQLP
jgi:hypothetical protein